MITGAHSIVFSTDAEADRTFFRDILGLPHVDAGEGWPIFGLPPAEVALHPWDENDVHRLYLICDDVRAFTLEMQRHGVATTPVEEQEWGLLTELTLPGGGKLGVYQPLHPRPHSS
ncbi:MAG: extradiol dioxygenase [Candidatus Eisenbacteria bacterium]|nr:extradiol dioxygenase [Candidatus Eisenbacteria bacterium]